jgi:hypothetical protein
MGRCLIVANQTLGGAQLDRAVLDRIERGDRQFFIVVPMTAARHETSAWSGGYAIHEGMSPAVMEQVAEEEARRREAMLEEAQRRAEDRLNQMIDRIQSAGGQVEGTVGDADPVVAVKEVLADHVFDEIIVSTLPPGISRWIKMDLPSRVARMTETPVTTIEADE